MVLTSVLSVSLGAVLGALIRWWLGGVLNPIFPSIPMGTLAVNLLGGFLMGVLMAATRNHLYLPEAARLGITTGFLGSLTTFSTFSAETITLLSHHEYYLSAVIITIHVAGSLLATILGIYSMKLLLS